MADPRGGDGRLRHRPDEHRPAGRSGGHALLMLACCVPIVIAVIALVATGVVGAGALVYALVCVAMMAVMMLVMPGHRH